MHQVVLGHEPGPQGVGAGAGVDPATTGSTPARQQLEQGGLAGAARPADRHDLWCTDGEVDGGEHGLPAPLDAGLAGRDAAVGRSTVVGMREHAPTVRLSAGAGLEPPWRSPGAGPAGHTVVPRRSPEAGVAVGAVGGGNRGASCHARGVRVEFADVALDPGAMELERAGTRVPVEPQVMEVLSYLVAHRAASCPRRSSWTRSGATASCPSRPSPAGSSRLARRSATTAETSASSGRCTDGGSASWARWPRRRGHARAPRTPSRPPGRSTGRR